MTTLSKAEIEAFDGLNQSYIEMEEKQNKIAPKCHFKAMFVNNGDGEDYNNRWWECTTCGHTKEIN